MNKIFFSVVLLSLLISLEANGQSRYQVDKAFFSTNKYDEFCPVLINDNLVFCSNLEEELFLTYKGKENKGLFNIFVINDILNSSNPEPQVFSKNLITPFNDGPAAFHPEGTMIVYSRNIDVKTKTKNIFDPNNNLGLYFAELIDGEWTNLVEFEYNDKNYSNTSPCYSPDGNFLYFASNRPGGEGGTDIYRCRMSDGKWGEPKNLGNAINTKGNEVYPFIAANGDLFFASDGHPGLGKKDIFVTRPDETAWIKPVHLDAPINSKEDDFGLITNEDFTEGYLSSNRARTDDIYQFTTRVPQLFGCDTLLDNLYCYEFWDELYPGMDSLPVIYEWEFSDGTKIRGLKVEHCLPGAGKHWAKLNIIDNSTSNTFFTQTSMEFELVDHIQPYISGRDAGVIKDDLAFSGLNSNIPGYNIEKYVWDFGDNNFDVGPEVIHSFDKKGDYYIKMGLLGFAEGKDIKETRCIIKPVTILSDNQSLAMFISGDDKLIIDQSESITRDSTETSQDFSVFDVNPDEEVFRVELLTSEDKIMIEDTIFDPLRDIYDIKEFYLSRDSLYSYTVGEYNSLLATYQVYNDVVEEGFTSATVKTYVLAELPTEIIAKINRDFAEFADANFEFSQSEVSETSYPILDQVARIMSENPDLVMEIAAHTDNVGSFEFNMKLSQDRAQSIVNYLVLKGVDSIRLVGKGYGESRPISTNGTESGRMNNRRVEFLILNQK